MAERPVRVGMFLLCMTPFLWLFYSAFNGELGPDPAERIMLATGEWTLRMLALTLLMTPLRFWTGSSLPLKLRRMLGLYVFFYGCLHFVTFLQFYIGWTGTALLEEIIERPYVSAGFFAWLMLVPLAFTSTRSMQRRLGRSWMKLHKLVYAVAIAACIHLVWQARSDIGEALVYSLVFLFLLVWRVRRSVLPRRG